MAEANLAATHGSARRYIKLGGVRVDGKKIHDISHELIPGVYDVKIGRGNYVSIQVMEDRAWQLD